MGALRRERAESAAQDHPKVVPHPAVIRTFLDNLLAVLEKDEALARALLKRLMPAVVLTPVDGGGFKLTGGFDLGATLDPDGQPPEFLRASSSRRDRD